MAVDDAVLQVELTQVPGSTLPARLTVHRDDTVTFNGKFGTAHSRLTPAASRELRYFTDLLGLKGSLKQYGNPEATDAIVAEVSVGYRNRQKDVVVCWDHHPRDASKVPEVQRVKMLVRRVVEVAKEQAWDHSSAAPYAQALYSHINSQSEASR